MESEFFGYERGVFMSVDVFCVGRFELVEKGLILFDEVIEIDLLL